MRFNVLASSGLLAASASAMPTVSANLTAALVRAPPALWEQPILSRNYTGVDISATTKLGVHYIEEAAKQGANLVAFPELWFPGYPRGNDGSWIPKWAKNYIENSITVGDANWNKILAAAKCNKVYVAIGYSEREGDAIYMAQALIGPDGGVLIHRHKLRPSGGERLIWSDGTMDELDVVSTPYGRIGILECWEHFHPSMTFPMQAMAEAIHIGAWPYMPDPKTPGAQYWETAEVNMAAAAVYAVNSGAYMLAPSVGRATAFLPTGLELDSVAESESYSEKPFLLVTINTTGFTSLPAYTVNGEQSWGVLEQIRDGWPASVPKDKGSFVNRVVNPVSSMLAKSTA